MTRKITNKIIINGIIKKFSFFSTILALLNSCGINNNIETGRGLFCSSDKDSKYILKLDSNNSFEIEYIALNVGIIHYYCKGKWSYVSKKRIIFECDTTIGWDWKAHPYRPRTWNPYFDKEYIKMTSKNEVFLFQENYKKVILRSDWCDCIPEYRTPIIQNKRRKE
jgi:hypothetical protein